MHYDIYSHSTLHYNIVKVQCIYSTVYLQYCTTRYKYRTVHYCTEKEQYRKHIQFSTLHYDTGTVQYIVVQKSSVHNGTDTVQQITLLIKYSTLQYRYSTVNYDT